LEAGVAEQPLNPPTSLFPLARSTNSWAPPPGSYAGVSADAMCASGVSTRAHCRICFDNGGSGPGGWGGWSQGEAKLLRTFEVVLRRLVRTSTQKVRIGFLPIVDLPASPGGNSGRLVLPVQLLNSFCQDPWGSRYPPAGGDAYREPLAHPLNRLTPPHAC